MIMISLDLIGYLVYIAWLLASINIPTGMLESLWIKCHYFMQFV
jgi:hypothetical protein